MADKKLENAGGGTGAVATDRLAAARAARKPRDPSLPALTDNDKYAIQLARQAGKACKMVADNLNKGIRPTPEVMKACALLSGSITEKLFA